MYQWKELLSIGKYIPLKQNEIFKKFIYLHVSCKLIKTLPTVIVFPPFSDLSSGDHIAAEVKMDGNTYFKHGIFIGHKDGIIDLVKMKNVDIFNFDETFKHQLLKITYPTNKSLPSQTVVENAKKMMNSCEVRSHDPRCQDSEKYASTCKTGMKEATVDINQQLNAFVSIVNVPTVPGANLSLGSLFGSI